MTGRHQVAACLLALLIAGLNLAPIELQRRIVDDAIVGQDAALLFWLAVCYIAIAAGHKGLKFVLGMYQTWLSESTIRYTRRHLLSIYATRLGPGTAPGPGDGGEDVAADDDNSPGRVVSIIGSEADKLGGFVGEGPSQACVDGAMLLGVVGYMAVVEPKIAALSLALLVPQVVVTPLMQRRLNTLTERRLSLMRDLGERVADGDTENARDDVAPIYENRLSFMCWKLALKAVLNLMNALAPISVLIWGGWLAIQGETTVGVLVAFLTGFERLSAPIRGLITFYRNAAQAEVQHNMIAKWM